jgi:16S rRNA (guanine966-N2)-methyltransferase
MRIIAGRWRGRRIAAPPGRDVRPTADRVRESWMSILTPVIPGARVLDLFAGSGALGLEALSRGATHVTFVERSSRVARVLEANVTALDAADEVTIVRGDALRFVRQHAGAPFDLALADPPYREGLAAPLVDQFREHPFARLLAVEHHRREVLPAGVASDQRRYGDTCITLIHPPDAL